MIAESFVLNLCRHNAEHFTMAWSSTESEIMQAEVKVLIHDIRVGFYWMSPDSRLMDEDFSENASKNFPSIIYLPCGLALP